ncbi:hypothetical protein QFW77_03440 [Luteimonas sp. RD2P54]|uniref:Beta-barrel assembly machine subunit BamC n=1 Tax=Luteimonas endophytica TaxID=3042023 RepID=A0ABT6J5D7_9GAMM|nr:hypothetical protein [Luteimonas endophytica]MDH5822048.1 hypothetical protein [Luteimonas endophytica]
MLTPGRVLPRMALVPLAATLALAACSRAGDALAEAAADRNAMEVPAPLAGDSGRRASAPLPLPPGFPEDVYLPPRYDIDSVVDMDGTTTVSLRAPGQVGALFGDADAAMARLGWQPTLSRRDAGDSAMLAFEKGSRTAVLSFARGHGDGGGVLVGLQLHERRQ